MANMEENLIALVSKAEADSELWHKIIHGNETTVVVTDNAIIPSVAKQLKDTHDEIVNGVSDYLGSCLSAKNETASIRDQTQIIKSEIEQLKTDTINLKKETEEYKNKAQTTYDSIETAVLNGISNIKSALSEQVAEAKSQADRAENATVSKANLDFSNINPTPSAILRIIDWLVPDWKRRSVLALNTEITITQHGWILMRNTAYTDNLYGYINGNMVFRQYGSYSHWEEWNSLSFLVGPGDIVKLTGGELTFMPCKGA